MNFLKIFEKTDRNERLTGQLFFRFMGPTMELDLAKRDLFAVVGNLAIPTGIVKNGHQLSIAGFKNNILDQFEARIDFRDTQDFEKRFRGAGIGQILLQPIWRI